MKTSIFLMSFFSKYWKGSKPLTSPAIRAANGAGSKRVIVRIPLRPAVRPSKFSSVPIPTGDSRPTPVTTTRLLKPPPLLLLGVSFDVLDGFLHPSDLLGVLIRNLDAEFLFEGHDEFDRVERIRAAVVHERRIRRHFVFVDAQLLHDDLLDLVRNRHSVLLVKIRGASPPAVRLRSGRPEHRRGARTPDALARGEAPSAYMYMPPLTASTCPVIYDASSDARKHTADATSSAVPSRFSGIFAAQPSCAPSAIARVRSVSTRPGATALTVMFRDATSSA